MNAVTTKGRVVGIEKFISRGRTSGNRKSNQLLYREVVSFFYNGNELFFIGSGGSSQISYQIGDIVKVEYVLHHPGSARIAGKVLLRNLSIVFFIVGLFIMGISCTTSTYSLNILLLKITTPFALLYVGYQLLKEKFKKQGGRDKYLSDNNSLKTKKEMASRDSFWSIHDVDIEEHRVHKPFLIITPILLSITAGTFYHFSTSFLQKSYIQQNLNEQLYDLNKLKVFIAYIMANSSLKKEFLILGICAFFILAFIYSFIYTLRKTK